MKDNAIIDALLFDLGNVVWTVDVAQAFAFWSKCAGPIAENLSARFAVDEFYEQHERGEISDEAFYDYLVKTLGIRIPYEEFTAGWKCILQDEIPGVKDLLLHLKDRIPLYAFSNTNELHRAAWLGRYDEALACFKRIFCSHEIGMRKPEKRAFLHVCKEMQTDPSRVLFLDDSNENVVAATEAGLRAAQVNNYAEIVDALCLHGIDL